MMAFTESCFAPAWSWHTTAQFAVPRESNLRPGMRHPQDPGLILNANHRWTRQDGGGGDLGDVMGGGQQQAPGGKAGKEPWLPPADDRGLGGMLRAGLRAEPEDPGFVDWALEKLWGRPIVGGIKNAIRLFYFDPDGVETWEDVQTPTSDPRARLLMGVSPIGFLAKPFRAGAGLVGAGLAQLGDIVDLPYKMAVLGLNALLGLARVGGRFAAKLGGAIAQGLGGSSGDNPEVGDRFLRGRPDVAVQALMHPEVTKHLQRVSPDADFSQPRQALRAWRKVADDPQFHEDLARVVGMGPQQGQVA